MKGTWAGAGDGGRQATHAASSLMALKATLSLLQHSQASWSCRGGQIEAPGVGLCSTSSLVWLISVAMLFIPQHPPMKEALKAEGAGRGFHGPGSTNNRALHHPASCQERGTKHPAMDEAWKGGGRQGVRGPGSSSHCAVHHSGPYHEQGVEG